MYNPIEKSPFFSKFKVCKSSYKIECKGKFVRKGVKKWAIKIKVQKN